MGDDAAHDDGEQVEGEVAARAQSQRTGEWDEQEEDRVKEDRNPEHEAAGHQREGRAGFAEDGDEAAHDFLGGTALHQGGADDRGDGDGEREFAGGAPQLVHHGIEGLDERGTAGGEDGIEDADENRGENQRKKGVQA